MGTGWKNVNLSPFFQFSPEPANNFSEENKVFQRLHFMIFMIFMIFLFLAVDPTQSYEENTKSLTQDFIDFAMK